MRLISGYLQDFLCFDVVAEALHCVLSSSPSKIRWIFTVFRQGTPALNVKVPFSGGHISRCRSILRHYCGQIHADSGGAQLPISAQLQSVAGPGFWSEFVPLKLHGPWMSLIRIVGPSRLNALRL